MNRGPRPILRLLIVLPSWVGDAVMATPAARLLRRTLPGVFIGALVRPGIDQVLAGLDLFDEVHVERASGVMGPKFVAAKIRPRRYDAVLLLTNSFSTALIARIAGIPVRVGYNRDARGLLLTHPLPVPVPSAGPRLPIPAVGYYWNAACELLRVMDRPAPSAPLDPATGVPREARMELVATAGDRAASEDVLSRAGIDPPRDLAILNPGGNNPLKRWPAERFAEIGRRLAGRGLAVLVNGSPAEADLAGSIAAAVPGGVSLPALGGSIASLKGMLASGRARIMVTNDTGPRHLAAAMRVPVVSLFGPTDPRWTTIPVDAGLEAILVADPTLPENEVADEHPDRCRVDRIELEAVWASARVMIGER